MTYTPIDWYWLADDGRLFSSRTSSLVDPAGEEYLAWSEQNEPTGWPRDEDGNQSDAALQWVFDNAGVNVSVGLDRLKAALKARVDAAAETERLKYITPGAGQAMTYQQKIEEVRALAQDTEPDAANYPLLSAEIGITAPSLEDVATAVLGAYQQWQQIGAAIERVRLGTKAAIDATASREEAEAAAAAAIWPAAKPSSG